MIIKTEEKKICSSCYYRLFIYAKHHFKLLFLSKQQQNSQGQFAALVSHCRNALVAITQIWSVLKNNFSETRKLDILESQGSF